MQTVPGVRRSLPWQRGGDAYVDPTMSVTAPGLEVPLRYVPSYSPQPKHLEIEDRGRTQGLLVGFRASARNPAEETLTVRPSVYRGGDGRLQ